MKGWPAGERWLENQGALLAQDPVLSGALASVKPGGPVGRGRDGRWVLRRNRGRVGLDLPPRAVQRALGTAAAPAVVQVLGVGAGELVSAALARWPGARVEAWDPEPAQLRVAMELQPLAAELRSGRLRLRCGAGLLDLHPAGPGVHEVLHPLLGRAAGPARAALAGGRPRVLLGEGGLFVDDLQACLEAAGWGVWRLHLDAVDPDWLLWNLRRLGARGIFGINHRLGLPEFGTAVGVPVVEWEIDPALDGMAPAAGPTDLGWLFTWRRANEAGWRERGFGNATFLPLAADPARRRPLPPAEVDRARYGAPVAFVGNSQAERTPQLRATLQGVLEVWARRRGHPQPAPESRRLVKLLFAEAQAALPRDAAAAILDTHCPGIREVAAAFGARADPAMLLAEMVGAVWRLQAVARLAPHGVHVWGDPGWQALRHTPVRIRGFAGHGPELTAIYNAVDINVDIARIYQPDIVTMRVFDVLACGGFLLAAWSPGLGELFELGEELDTWSTLDELEAKVRHYAARPDLRRRIAERGRERVLRDHQIRHRVSRMLQASGLGEVPPPAGGAVD